MLLLLAVCPGATQFEPPRIISVINPPGGGRGSDAARIYCIDKGVESNINMGDVLNVYREKRAVRGSPAVRLPIGTMRVQSIERDFALGRFTASEAALSSPSIRHHTPMKSDIAVPVHVVETQILFEPGRITLRPGAEAQFQKMADFVEEYSPARLVIEGHTDADGETEVNQELSEARAEAVRQYLIETFDSITPAMCESRGYGGMRPAVPNDSPENKARNQRIEVIVWG